jgi:hypothetical protein
MMKQVYYLVVLICVLIALTACGGISSNTTSNQPAADNSRCVQASSAQLNIIQSGVRGVDADNYVKTAWAVKSNDFNNVWMVAAFIYGTGMENGTGPGAWAISGDANSPGLTLAVDGFAQSFTNYPDASKSDAQISPYDDGVQEAIACAESHK